MFRRIGRGIFANVTGADSPQRSCERRREAKFDEDVLSRRAALGFRRKRGLCAAVPVVAIPKGGFD
jgi:hypothetical protein